jgi:hypothetical protein
MKEVKIDKTKVDAEITNNNKPIFNSYLKNVTIYMRSCLRYISCYFTLYVEGSDLDPSILGLLKKIDRISDLSINFIIPISFRIELNYLFALYYKFEFYREVNKVQIEYIKK